MMDFVETPTYYLVRRTDVGTTWAIYELWATGLYRGPFNTREEAIEREELIAKEYEWTLTLLDYSVEYVRDFMLASHISALEGMLQASGCYQDLEGNVVWRREWPWVAKALEFYKQATGREAPDVSPHEVEVGTVEVEEVEEVPTETTIALLLDGKASVPIPRGATILEAHVTIPETEGVEEKEDEVTNKPETVAGWGEDEGRDHD